MSVALCSLKPYLTWAKQRFSGHHNIIQKPRQQATLARKGIIGIMNLDFMKNYLHSIRLISQLAPSQVVASRSNGVPTVSLFMLPMLPALASPMLAWFYFYSAQVCPLSVLLWYEDVFLGCVNTWLGQHFPQMQPVPFKHHQWCLFPWVNIRNMCVCWLYSICRLPEFLRILEQYFFLTLGRKYGKAYSVQKPGDFKCNIKIKGEYFRRSQ